MKKILLAAALCATSLTALAEGVMADSYVQLNAGYALGTKAGNNFNAKKMKNAGLVGVEAGYRFTENFRTSLSLDFVPNAKYNGSLTNASLDNANISTKVKSYAAMVNFYYDVADFSGFTPYATAGFGAAKNKTGTSTSQSSSLAGSSKTNLAWKLGFGTRYAVNSAVDLDLRYQFANLGKYKTSQPAGYDRAAEGTLKQHQFLVGVAYKF